MINKIHSEDDVHIGEVGWAYHNSGGAPYGCGAGCGEGMDNDEGSCDGSGDGDGYGFYWGRGYGDGCDAGTCTQDGIGSFDYQ